VRALREYYLGPGRAELVDEIKRQLTAEAKTSKADLKRLEKRAAELEREVGRLVRAIRTIDAPELAEELASVRRERHGVQDALQQAQRFQDGQRVSTKRPRAWQTSYGGLERGYPTTTPPRSGRSSAGWSRESSADGARSRTAGRASMS
jgi:hypothetical protein